MVLCFVFSLLLLVLFNGLLFYKMLSLESKASILHHRPPDISDLKSVQPYTPLQSDRQADGHRQAGRQTETDKHANIQRQTEKLSVMHSTVSSCPTHSIHGTSLQQELWDGFYYCLVNSANICAVKLAECSHQSNDGLHCTVSLIVGTPHAVRKSGRGSYSSSKVYMKQSWSGGSRSYLLPLN